MPARHCFAVGAMDLATASLGEPLGVAVHGVRIRAWRIGQRVLVLGAGTIGLMAVVAARAGGAGEILVTARRPQQKAAALALGADRVFDDSDEAALFAAAGESPIDVVIESVGGIGEHARHRRRAQPARRHDLPARRVHEAVAFPALITVAHELTIKGSLVYNRAGSRADFDVAVDLLHRHGAQLAKTMITHRFPLDRLGEAFETAADKNGLDQGDGHDELTVARRKTSSEFGNGSFRRD